MRCNINTPSEHIFFFDRQSVRHSNTKVNIKAREGQRSRTDMISFLLPLPLGEKSNQLFKKKIFFFVPRGVC